MGHVLPTDVSVVRANDGDFSFTNLQANFVFPILILLSPGVAQVLLYLKLEIVRVWGVSMMIYALFWWSIGGDTAQSRGLSWAIFLAWCIASIRYYENAFKKSHRFQYPLILVIVITIVVDFGIVKFMGQPELQANPFSLLLPSAAGALYITANFLTAYCHQQKLASSAESRRSTGVLMPELA